MGNIQDLMSLIRKGPEFVAKTNNIMNRKTIVSGAKDATFMFPFFITDSNSPMMAHVTVQTFDRVYAEYAKTWLSLNSMYDVTLDPTPISHLKKLHQNIRFEMTGPDIDENTTMDAIVENCYNGEYQLYMNSDKTCGVIFSKSDNPGSMRKSYQENMEEYLSDLDLKPFDLVEEFGNRQTHTAGDLADAIIDAQIAKTENEIRDKRLSASDKLNHPKLGSRDEKKANDIMPYTINARFIVVNDKKEFIQYVDVVVGVKAYMHVIPSDEMVENIGRAVQNKSLLFKTLRWATGEISLMKDIILNINDIRDDAAAKQRHTPVFGVLKRLRDSRVGLRNFTVPTALIPNATFCISVQEASELKDRYGIDVNDVRVVRKIISSLFLMAFVIIDDGSETVSILYNNSTDFETYSSDALGKENREYERAVRRDFINSRLR